MERFCTSEYVYHCFVIVFDIGEGGMIGCIEKSILYSKFVRKVKIEEIGAACVAYGRAMRSKHSFEFFTVSFANFHIDISTDNDLGVFGYKLQ